VAGCSVFGPSEHPVSTAHIKTTAARRMKEVLVLSRIGFVTS
jgi:hypothetical protein